MQKFVSLIVLLLMISSTPVFAQENLTSQILTLNTDKEAYYDGDVITITGKVTKVISGEEIILQIFFGKNLIGIDKVSVTQDGEFTKTIRTGGPLWQNEGNVVVKITYGKESTETVFQFFKQTGTDFASIYEVDIPDGGTFDIEYTMKGGVVDSMTVNPHSLSLDIGILTNSDGALDISIPRNALDSIDENGFDTEFIILIYSSNEVNPVQTDYNKIEFDDESRSIYIPIKNGDSKIQIVGTSVIPEFGVLIQLVLIVAIITTIIISARTRLLIFPKP